MLRTSPALRRGSSLRSMAVIHGEPEQMDRDAKRTAWLESQGYMVLRFRNDDVTTNLSGVLEAVHAAIVRKGNRRTQADVARAPPIWFTESTPPRAFARDPPPPGEGRRAATHARPPARTVLRGNPRPHAAEGGGGLAEARHRRAGRGGAGLRGREGFRHAAAAGADRARAAGAIARPARGAEGPTGRRAGEGGRGLPQGGRPDVDRPRRRSSPTRRATSTSLWSRSRAGRRRR